MRSKNILRTGRNFTFPCSWRSLQTGNYKFDSEEVARSQYIYISKRVRTNAFLYTIVATILITPVVVYIAIAALFMPKHSSTILQYEYPISGHLAYEPLSDEYVQYVPEPQMQLLSIEPINLPLPIPPPPMPSPPQTPFSAFSFYIPENAHLYAYFQYSNPTLTAETVVWKVNAHLHLPFYYDIRTNYNPNPLLVNPFYRLPQGFSPYPLVPVNNSNCFLRATPETVAAFRALRTTARQNGFDLSVTSAFRTAARQAALFSARNYVDGVVARPYHSEHQTGRALDLWGPGGLLDARGPSPTGTWVAANAHYYGFIIRYRAETTHITGFIYEPWHITYVGIDISMYMHDNTILSLEEFVARYPEATLNRG